MSREAEILQLLQDVFSQERGRLASRRVVMFGSRARGDYWVDLARTNDKFRQSALVHHKVIYEA
jgi:predicted nucleotidyltransferase